VVDLYNYVYPILRLQNSFQTVCANEKVKECKQKCKQKSFKKEGTPIKMILYVWKKSMNSEHTVNTYYR